MAWDIDSTQISNPQVRSIRDRLLAVYFGVMIVLLGTFGLVAYRAIEHECNREVNDRLQQLADSAARTLQLIRHEYDELVPQTEEQHESSNQKDRAPDPLTVIELLTKYETDTPFKVGTALEIPSSSALANQIGLEWFDDTKKLLIAEGHVFSQQNLPGSIATTGTFLQHQQIRSYILPVYQSHGTGKHELIGYVRANTSTIPLEEELQRLRWSLSFSAVIMLGIMIISSIWLMRESIKPILISLEQLKQFTSDASHELRNPLTAIRASVSVMQRHPERIHPADVAKLGAIASASEQMSTLVEDLLLLARMEQSLHGKQGWLAIDLSEMLEDLLLLVESEAEQKGITLKANLISNGWIEGNGEQIKRLFLNLLSNALQYTDSGGTITVSMQKRSDNLVIQIEDTGIGIAPEHLPYIFDRFWRADPARQKSQSGFGLGLAISQAIALHHRGKITVMSQLAIGTQFQVYFPLLNHETFLISRQS